MCVLGNSCCSRIQDPVHVDLWVDGPQLCIGGGYSRFGQAKLGSAMVGGSHVEQPNIGEVLESSLTDGGWRIRSRSLELPQGELERVAEQSKLHR